MASTSGGGGDSRRIDLSNVKSRRRNLKDPFVSLSYDEYIGDTTKQASLIVADSGEAQGVGRRPTDMIMARSEKNPGDLIGIPTAVESDSNTKIRWVRQGTMARIELDKILAMENITIPKGSRMYIKIYADEDAHFGKVIGMKVNSAEFEPIVEREKKGAQSQDDKNKRKGPDDQQNKGTGGEMKTGGEASASAKEEEAKYQEEKENSK